MYLLNGKLVFLYNFLDLERIRWEGKDALTPGKHTIVFDFKYDGPGFPALWHVKGSQEVQNPAEVGTVVRSACHRWLGYLAVTDCTDARGCRLDVNGGAGLSRRMRPTLVAPRCRPARASIWAIFTLPRRGQSTCRRCTKVANKVRVLVDGYRGAQKGVRSFFVETGVPGGNRDRRDVENLSRLGQ